MSVQAAKKKPEAVVTATYTTLPNGKVVVTVTSNATKAQVKYRTAKNKKRALNKKLKRGAATITLPVGSKTITGAGQGHQEAGHQPLDPRHPTSAACPSRTPDAAIASRPAGLTPGRHPSHSPGGDPACGSSGEPAGHHWCDPAGEHQLQRGAGRRVQRIGGPVWSPTALGWR